MVAFLWAGIAGFGQRCRGGAFSGVVLLLLAGCATPEPPPLPERVDLVHGHGRFWQIDREGLEPSYLFGTFHISDARVIDLPDVVEQAFVRAPTAAFEYDHKNEESPYTLKRMELPEGTTLRSLIGSGAYGRLTSVMQGRGFYGPRNDIKPWAFWDYLGGTRGTFYTSDDESERNKPVLDTWLQERAFSDDKKVVGLETREEGFIKYDSIPMPQQVDLLKATLENFYRRRAGAPMVQAYLDGDLGMLEAFWREGLGWYPPEVAQTLDFRIVTNRNRIMVERALPLMEEASTFIAVGAGHLAGEEGILRLLEQQGFTVTRLH